MAETRARDLADLGGDATGLATDAELTSGLASKLDAAELNNFTAFTPTFSGGNWSVGNGTFSSETGYASLGDMVFFAGTFTFGSTTATDGSSALDISLPVTASGSQPMAGVVGFLDSGTANYAGIATFTTTTAFRPNRMAVSGSNITYSGLTTNNPFTWATNDVIRWLIIYRAA